jgi:excisionase family DNA binding protein
MNQDEKLTVNETARQLSVRVDSVYKLLWAGLLKGHRVDGRWEISAESVEEYAIKHSRQARAASVEDRTLTPATV